MASHRFVPQNLFRMNTVLRIFLLGFFAAGFWAVGCKPNAEESKEHVLYYNGGAVQRRYFTVNDEFQGQMTEYYTDGKLKSERFFENGVQTGRTVFYYPSGKIKEVQYFENGKQQRGDTLFYEDGKPQFLVSFRDGKKDGYLRKWTPEGEVSYEARYQMDTLVEVKGEPVTPEKQ